VRSHEDRLYQFTFAIVQYEADAQEIWTTLLTAAEIGAVTAAAFEVVNRASLRDDRRVCRIALLCRETRHAPTPLREHVRAQQAGENARTYRTQRT
jgi:hypothetical protein